MNGSPARHLSVSSHAKTHDAPFVPTALSTLFWWVAARSRLFAADWRGSVGAEDIVS